MEETISIQGLIDVLKRRIRLILVMSLAGILISALATFFIFSPTYQSDTQLIVTLPEPEDPTANPKDSGTNLMLLNTCKDFITGNAVLSATKDNLVKEFNYKGSTSDLAKLIMVNQNASSQMFSIVASGATPNEAAVTANTVASIFATKVKKVLPVESVTIIYQAKENKNAISPNVKFNLLIGLIVGLLFGIGLSFLLDFFSDSVKDERFGIEELGFPLLGNIPEMSIKAKK